MLHRALALKRLRSNWSSRSAGFDDVFDNSILFFLEFTKNVVFVADYWFVWVVLSDIQKCFISRLHILLHWRLGACMLFKHVKSHLLLFFRKSWKFQFFFFFDLLLNGSVDNLPISRIHPKSRRRKRHSWKMLVLLPRNSLVDRRRRRWNVVILKVWLIWLHLRWLCWVLEHFLVGLLILPSPLIIINLVYIIQIWISWVLDNAFDEGPLHTLHLLLLLYLRRLHRPNIIVRNTLIV